MSILTRNHHQDNRDSDSDCCPYGGTGYDCGCGKRIQPVAEQPSAVTIPVPSSTPDAKVIQLLARLTDATLTFDTIQPFEPPLRLNDVFSPQLDCLVQYLYYFPGADTKMIISRCDIDNISSLLSKPKSTQALEQCGLRIMCRKDSVRTRFGEYTLKDRWYLMRTNQAYPDGVVCRQSRHPLAAPF